MGYFIRYNVQVFRLVQYWSIQKIAEDPSGSWIRVSETNLCQFSHISYIWINQTCWAHSQSFKHNRMHLIMCSMSPISSEFEFLNLSVLGSANVSTRQPHNIYSAWIVSFYHAPVLLPFALVGVLLHSYFLPPDSFTPRPTLPYHPLSPSSYLILLVSSPSVPLPSSFLCFLLLRLFCVLYCWYIFCVLPPVFVSTRLTSVALSAFLIEADEMQFLAEQLGWSSCPSWYWVPSLQNGR